MEADDLVEPGDLEQLADPLGHPDDQQVAPVRASPLQRADHDAEPDRVDEVDAAEIDDEVRPAATDDADHLLAQTGRGGQLELAR